MRWPIASDVDTNLNTFRYIRPLDSIVRDVLKMDSCELVSRAHQCERVSSVSIDMGYTGPDSPVRISVLES